MRFSPPASAASTVRRTDIATLAALVARSASRCLRWSDCPRQSGDLSDQIAPSEDNFAGVTVGTQLALGVGMNRLQFSSSLALLLAACGGSELDDPLAETGGAATASQVYDAIKAFEGRIPIPTTDATVFVGWIDGQTGAVWLDSAVDVGDCGVIYPPGPFPGDGRQCEYALANINAVNAHLQFGIFNQQGVSVRVEANGRVVNAPRGADSVTVAGGRENRVGWSVRVRSGGNPASHFIRIERPRAAMGAFIIGVLPMSIIYEPPQPPLSRNRNWAQYTTMSSVGSSMSVVGGSRSVTVDLEEPLTFGGAVGSLAPVADKIYEGAGGVFSAVSSGLGSMNTRKIDDVASFDGTSVSLSTTRSTTIRTNANLGPGAGDLFFYLTNVKMAWVYDGERVLLTMLDYDREVTETAATIKARVAALQRQNSNSPQLLAWQELLALDPFVTGGAYATPRGSRFDSEPAITVNGASRTDGLSRTLTRTDMQASARTRTVLESYHAGWMSFLGLGETRNGSKQMSVSYKATRETTVGQTNAATMQLNARANERYTVYVWYDRVFNTWATRSPKPWVVKTPRGGGAN